MKEFLQKNLITILCVIAIVALFLPFCTVSTNISVFGTDSSQSSSVNGFASLGKTFVAYALILGPVLLIVMNYIKKLEKYQGILAIAVPAVCIVCAIITFFVIKTAESNSDGGLYSVEIKTGFGFGAILIILDYIALIVAGAVKYHNFTLDKNGIEKIKTEGIGFIKSAKDTVSENVQNISADIGSRTSQIGANGTPAIGASSAKTRKIDTKNNEEILNTITRLHKMKEDGILTEEEFEKKKSEYLEML